MIRDKTGPFGGVCDNFRFTFDDTISRVITVTYDNNNLVNPETEVYLTSESSRKSKEKYIPCRDKGYAQNLSCRFNSHHTLT